MKNQGSGIKWCLLALTALFLCGCGYRCGDTCLAQKYSSVTVPYVGCDDDGRMTDALVRALSASGELEYRQCGGQLCLEAKIINRGRENIGYRFDTDNSGEIIERLIPDEGRLIYRVEVTLTDSCRGCRVLGPFCVEAWEDYPWDPLATDTNVSVESLGQYTGIDEAERIARGPLYDRLAQKIVDILVAAW